MTHLLAGAAALAMIAGAALAQADDAAVTGQVRPPLLRDNPILADLDHFVRIVTVQAPPNFAQMLIGADPQGIIRYVYDIDAAGVDPDVIIAFVGTWDRARGLAAALRMPSLTERYDAAEAAGNVIDYTMRPTGDGPLHLYVIAQDTAPYPVPDICWARLVMGSLYVGGVPAPFTLRACTESITGPLPPT